MQLRRMPADGSGKTGWCQPGGLLAALAEDMEENVLSVAKGDVDRALALAEDGKVTRAELIRALYFLGHSCRAAVDVAELRGERLETAQCDALADVPGDSWQYGPCNLPAGHGGTHVNDSCHSWKD